MKIDKFSLKILIFEIVMSEMLGLEEMSMR